MALLLLVLSLPMALLWLLPLQSPLLVPSRPVAVLSLPFSKLTQCKRRVVKLNAYAATKGTSWPLSTLTAAWT